MWRLIFLISAIPFIVAGIAAQLLGFRILKTSVETHLDVDTFLCKLRKASGLTDLKFVYSPKFWAASANIHDSQITLSDKIRLKKDANSIAQASLLFGLYYFRKKHQSTVDWRLNTVKSGYILPVFVALVALFTSLVGKLPPKIALAAISASFGFTTVMLWLSMPVEREAAKFVIKLIEEHRLFSRLREEEAVVSAIHATVWASLIPGVLKGLMQSNQSRKSPDS